MGGEIGKRRCYLDHGLEAMIRSARADI